MPRNRGKWVQVTRGLALVAVAVVGCQAIKQGLTHHLTKWQMLREEQMEDPIQAVGGLSVEQAILMPRLGAPLVVIGAPLVIDDREFKPGDADNALEAMLRHIVTEVKKVQREQ